MAMSDWEKKGEDWYKLKKKQHPLEKGELYIIKEPYDEIHKIGSRIVKVVKKIRYFVVEHYTLDGNQPDYHRFKTKEQAHQFIMKRIKGRK